MILVQPTRCGIDDCTDSLRLALVESVSGSTTKNVLYFRDFRLKLTASTAPCRIRGEALRIHGNERIPATRFDAEGFHISVSAGDVVELRFQVLDEIDNMCMLAEGYLLLGDAKQVPVVNGVAETTYSVPRSVSGRLVERVRFVPTSSAASDASPELNVIFDIMIGTLQYAI
jgi:hypothetical protein